MGPQISCVGQGVHQALKLRTCIAEFALGAVCNMQRIEKEPSPKGFHRELMPFAFKEQNRSIIWRPRLGGRLIFAFAAALVYDGVQNRLGEGDEPIPGLWEGRTPGNIVLRDAMDTRGCLRAWRSQDFFWRKTPSA